jgi:hypothetical protein
MSIRVTVTLRDDVYRQVEQLAQLANVKVAEMLSEAIELSLPSVIPQSPTVKPITALSDEEVVKLTELQMAPREDRRLSRLLERQQAGKLKPEERAELLRLMQVYQAGLLRKAQALNEAVQRGLRTPLEP